ncbi:MAG: response regulator [Chitinispirillales bacterium]|jgi:CheY-like chemotaxis protein|nr:response regulator [Chitinispirillales bacterium]
MKLIVIPIALLAGAAVFVALLMIIKGGYFATRRRKTKLGLVKVAGAGLKLNEDDEPEDSCGRHPDIADEGDAEVVTAGIGTDSEAGGADVNTVVDKDDAGGIEAAAADTAVDALSDEVGYGENAEYEETLAVPIESINEEKDDVAGLSPPSKISADVDERDSIGAAVRRGEGRTGDKLPLIGDGSVRKIVELPVENPFIGGKMPSLGDGHAKKTTMPQRRRLPETVKMKDRKVILAEDVAINRDLIAMYFDGSGVKFEFAVNGREVCEKFERDPGAYSMILMDIQMPEMDGYEVSRRIRSMDVDWAKQIPIIAMTGNDQKEDIDRCFEAGMDDHIPKPIDMEVLQEKVFDIITLNAESF